MSTFLDDVVNSIHQQDFHKRQLSGQELLEYIQNPTNSLECENFGQLIDGLVHWVSGSNFKVSLLALECIGALTERMKDGFKMHIVTVLPAVQDRLGDSKDAVRDQAQALIQKLMHVASAPQYVFERLMRAFNHKNYRVREEVLLCLMQTINTSGASSISLHKIVPSICKLLGDPNSQVRDTAINTLVEIYRHVGEKVRIDLGKKGIPSSRLAIIYGKFDDVKKSGRMIAEDTGVKVSSAQDEVDSARVANAARIKARPSTTGTIKKTVTSRVGSAPASTSQGVDDDLFLSSFEDVPEVTIYSAKGLEEDLAKIREILTNDKNAWDFRITTLKKIRSYVIAGAKNYDGFLQQVKLLENALSDSAKDLRSQVVREACITISFLSMSIGRHFDYVAELLLPSLFNLIPNSVKVMSSSGLVALNFIIKYTHSPRLLPPITSYMSVKSVPIRRQTMSFICIILSSWDTHSLERHVGVLEESIRRGIEDADSEARSFGRKAFWAFAEHFKSQADKLLHSLDVSKQKMLHGELGQSSSTGSLNIQPKSSSLSKTSSHGGSHENIGTSRVAAKKPISHKTETDGYNKLSTRSNSDINLSAAKRSKSRYATSGQGAGTLSKAPQRMKKSPKKKKVPTATLR